MGENIKIGLTTHPLNDGNKWNKSSLGQVESITKRVHVELATESMKEATHIIT